MKGVVVIGSVLPSTNYSGGLFVASILRSGAFPVAGYIALQARVLSPVVPLDLRAAFPMKVLYKRSEFADSAENLTGERLRAFEVQRRQDAVVLTRQILQFCDAVEAGQIWIVLEGQTLILVANALLQTGRYPVRVQVMDPPGWQLRAGEVDPDTVREILDIFDETVSRAVACAAASWNMAKIYHDRYSVRMTPVVPALSASLACRPRPLAASPTLQIGFAGQPYAVDEFKALLMALTTLQKERPTGRVVLHTFTGWSFEVPANSAAKVVRHAWTKQAALIPMLSEMDLLYCPYWFDPTYREETVLCFPSKVTTYLAAGRPILFHGRNDASPALFLRSAAAAFFCFRPDADSLRHTIETALSNPETYLEKAANGTKLFLQHLTEDRLAEAIREFLAD